MENNFKIHKIRKSTRHLSSIINNKIKLKKPKLSKNSNFSLNKNIHQSYCKISKNFKTMKVNFFSEIINLKSKLKNDDFLSEKSTKKNLIEIFKFLSKSLNHLPGFESIIEYLFKSTIFFAKDKNFENIHFEENIKEFKEKIIEENYYFKKEKFLEKREFSKINNILNINIENFLDFKSICFKLKKDLIFIMDKFKNIENEHFELKNNFEEMKLFYVKKLENKKKKISKFQKDFLNLKKEKFFVLQNFMNCFFKIKKNTNNTFKLHQNLHELNEVVFSQSKNINSLEEEILDQKLFIINLKEEKKIFENKKLNLEKNFANLNKILDVKNKNDLFIKTFYKDFFIFKEKFRDEINNIFCNVKKDKILDFLKKKNKKKKRFKPIMRNSVTVENDRIIKKIKVDSSFLKKKRFSIKNKSRSIKRNSIFENIFNKNEEKQKNELFIILEKMNQQIYIFIRNLCEINKIDVKK